MPRNAEVIRQWTILREIERARGAGVTIDELSALCDVTTRTIRRDLQESLTGERVRIDPPDVSPDKCESLVNEKIIQRMRIGLDAPRRRLVVAADPLHILLPSPLELL